MNMKKILFIYPEFPDTFWSFTYALGFIGKKAAFPPLGLITVAALLPEKWDKRLTDTNVERLSDKDILWADLVFIGGMTVQRASARHHGCGRRTAFYHGTRSIQRRGSPGAG